MFNSGLRTDIRGKPNLRKVTLQVEGRPFFNKIKIKYK